MGSKDKDGLNISLIFLKIFIIYGLWQKSKEKEVIETVFIGKNISKR